MSPISLAVYSSLIPSGIASSPLMPSHWSTSRTKYLAVVNPSKSEVAHLPDDTFVSFLPMEAIGEQGQLDTKRTKKLGDLRSGYTYLRDGDVCIAKITPCFENGKGAVISQLEGGIGFATTEVIPFRCTEPLDAKFLYYLLTSAPFSTDAEGSMYGAGGQKRVADSYAANYAFVVPPSRERTQIAKFLDYETARIDALIEKQQQLIALLKEKRQAVISHAVTKGLNPNAPMRDSGVEWLGQVPAHWEIVKLKHLVALPIIDGPHETPTKCDEGVPFVSAEAVSSGQVDFRKMWGFISHEAHARYRKRYVSTNGDILMVKLGATTGTVAMVDTSIEFNVWVPLAVIRCNEAVHSRFVLNVLRSKNLINAYEVNWTYGTQQTLGLRTIENLPIPVPPESEQEEIVTELSATMPRLELLSEKAVNGIELLQERRTALISAAVTGKIDVRDWQPPDNSEAA